MNAFSICALVFVEGSTVELPTGECDLDFDLEFPLGVLADKAGCVGLPCLVWPCLTAEAKPLLGLVWPCLVADLPLLGLVDEAISIDGLLVDSSLFLCSR